MASAKDIVVKAVSAKAANDVVKQVHYSGKVVPNSKLHFGVYLGGRLEGVMSFGPSMDKRKSMAFVAGTQWNGFLELNRMAFSDRLPKNSESRALGVAMRLIKKHYPHIEWIVSYADGSQCGDGTIYRASGFVLTGIKKNTSMLRFPDGEVYATLPITNGGSSGSGSALKRRLCEKWGVPFYSGATVAPFKKIGAEFVPGFQLRYLYFIKPEARKRLTLPILPFSKIDEMGAGMYKGQARVKQATTDDQSAGRRGSTDPHAPNQKLPT